MESISAISMIYTFGKVSYNLASRTHVMGILNVTPDSFSDGGHFYDKEDAVRRGLQMIEEGADCIDVGGESTRPGSEAVSAEEEIRRVVPVIGQLVKLTDIPISVDTYKSSVAQRALDAGATIVNDISGLKFDPAMAGVVSRSGASLVLMHIKGMPKFMQEHPEYENVVEEVILYLEEGVRTAERHGIKQLFIDPGIGFGKTVEHNLELLRNLRELQRLGYPVLVGPSRKSFIGKILDLPAEERLEGTAAAVAASIMNGANVIRVHDVKEMKRVAQVIDTVIRT